MAKFVLTLIAPKSKEILDHPLIDKVCAALTREGTQVLGQEWLAEYQACDVFFTRSLPEIAETAAKEAIGERAVDCVAQPTESRQKRMLISDMDSTMITVECIDEIADFAGMKAQVAAITERAMRGELDFAAALNERLKLLAGLPEDTLQHVYDERVAIMPGARELVATMKSQGAFTVLVSGGFDFFTSRMRDAIGFDLDSSNRLEIENGKLTGRIIPPLLDKSAKFQTLIQLSAERGISLSSVMAVGDGANDIPMLMAAGLGVAYHAKPVVQKSARARINYCDLTALLYMQGYKEEELVAAA